MRTLLTISIILIAPSLFAGINISGSLDNRDNNTDYNLIIKTSKEWSTDKFNITTESSYTKRTNNNKTNYEEIRLNNRIENDIKFCRLYNDINFLNERITNYRHIELGAGLIKYYKYYSIEAGIANRFIGNEPSNTYFNFGLGMERKFNNYNIKAKANWLIGNETLPKYILEATTPIKDNLNLLLGVLYEELPVEHTQVHIGIQWELF